MVDVDLVLWFCYLVCVATLIDECLVGRYFGSGFSSLALVLVVGLFWCFVLIVDLDGFVGLMCLRALGFWLLFWGVVVGCGCLGLCFSSGFWGVVVVSTLLLGVD